MNDDVRIRPFRGDDADAVRGICVQTATGPMKEPQMRGLLLTAFCNYYIEQEPAHCFVAADTMGVVAGYILCAEDAGRFAEVFRSEYIAKASDEAVARFLEGSVSTPLRYAKEYPAHLHIDISPLYQRMGIGTRLMDALVRHLKDKNIKGLMLSVGNDNAKGINFYKKYGFACIARLAHETVMGIKLST